MSHKNNTIDTLAQGLTERFSDTIDACTVAHHAITLEVSRDNIRSLCRALRDELPFKFEVLIDVCGVDYLDYGMVEWTTDDASQSGFGRAVVKQPAQRTRAIEWPHPRFAVVYHLLSTTYNQRLRLRVFLTEDDVRIPSVESIWPAANWFEREAFDLYGILFEDHPDLRRILTDYGFVGHPFRKDFPVSGDVEMRYDATAGRVIYEPVDIEPRVLVPKVRRDDNRYGPPASVTERDGS